MDGKSGAEELIAKVLKDPTSAASTGGGAQARGRGGPDPGGGQLTWPRPIPRQSAEAQVQTGTIEAGSFASLLQQEFKPRTDRAREAVEGAVATLASQALAQSSLISDDAVRTIESIIAEIDKKLTDQVNQILHHQDFQQLEGAWRGLHHLVNNTETDEMLKIRVMNISKKRAAQDT